MTCLKLTADMRRVGWAWPSQVRIRLKLCNEGHALVAVAMSCGHTHRDPRSVMLPRDSFAFQVNAFSVTSNCLLMCSEPFELCTF